MPPERWIWVELIGFDNTQADLGVAEYLATVGFTPQVVCLFLFSPDFVLLHRPGEEVTFPPDYCSYNAHPHNGQRARQVWTSGQLRRLVGELHGRGIRVYLSVMTFHLADRCHREWASDHREVLEVDRTGQVVPALHPLKRLADGSRFQDLFLPRLLAALDDYGFDGWHACDGWGPARLPVYCADFSDDLVGQFAQATGLALPAPCDGDPVALEQRAAAIWQEHARAWIDFYAGEWEAFYRRYVPALHAAGKAVAINSAWTRDPFEALYRYGIDYARLAAAGIDAFVVEACAGALDLLLPGPGRHWEYMAALLLLRAAAPDATVVALHGLKDACEQWDLLRHDPCRLEREICGLGDLYRVTESGITRAADGLLCCLGDAIRPAEWQWLQERWELAFPTPAAEPWRGVTVLWSQAALPAQVDDYLATGRWPVHRLLHHLMAAGAPIRTVTTPEHLDRVTGPLLVLNPHLLPPAELQQALAYQAGPLVLIGPNLPADPQPALHFADGTLACAAYNCHPERSCTARCSAVEGPSPGPNSSCHPERSHADKCGDAGTCHPERSAPKLDRAKAGEVEGPSPDLQATLPPSFADHLPFRDLSPAFLADCARLLADLAGGVRVLEGEGIAASAVELSPHRLRLFIAAGRPHYTRAKLDLGQPVKAVHLRTAFPFAAPEPAGTTLEVVVPPEGVVVVEVDG